MKNGTTVKRYRIFNHTADLGVDIFGQTPENLFANAAHTLCNLVTDTRTVRLKEAIAISVKGTDWPDLLINYLRELLYLWNAEGLLLKKCDIKNIDAQHVTAIASGERFDPSRHIMKMEIKAVTYHQASLVKTETGWKGRVVFDV